MPEGKDGDYCRRRKQLSEKEVVLTVAGSSSSVQESDENVEYNYWRFWNAFNSLPNGRIFRAVPTIIQLSKPRRVFKRDARLAFVQNTSK